MELNQATNRGFLTGGGEAGRLIGEFDWSGTSLGPIERWPQCLKTATAILLRSPVPMVMLWGPDGVMLYNNAYSAFAGGRHPQLLGSKVREGWPEVADFNDNVMRVGLAGGTLAYRDQELTLYRHGRPEQVFMNLDYSPVLDESGEPAGVLAIVVETTAHVAAERRLRESEGRFRALINASSDVVYRMSPDWTEMRQLDGRGFIANTEKPSVRWMEDYIFPEDRPLILAAIGKALRSKGVFELEHRVRRVDGAAGWTYSRAVPVFDADGAIVEWFGMASDITARREAEEGLRESEARFRLMADAVPQIVWITDAQGGLEFFNKQWSDYTGADGPTSPGPVTAAFVHPDDEARTMAAFAEAQRKGAVFEVEHRIRRRDGVYRWFLVRAEPYRDPSSGEIVRWFGACVDIHDRKLAEAALQESETRFRGMADHAPVMMWVTDPTGRCTYLNANWSAFTGQAPDFGEGYGWLDAVHPDDRSTAERAFLTANAEQRDYRVDFRLRRTDGVYRWVIDAAAARFSGDGEYLGYVGSVIDIDERREAEDALRASEERYRTLFEAIDAGFCVVEVAFDDDGRPVDYRFVETNPAFERQTGLKDVAGRTARELVPDLEPHWCETYGAVALTGQAVRFENGSDAMGRWFDVHALRVGPPEARRVAILFNDISDRRAAENALRELNVRLEERVAEALAERKLLADIVETTDAQVQVLDRDYRWLAINKACADAYDQIYGKRPTIGESLLDLLADRPEQQAAARALWSRALAGEAFTVVGEFGDPALDSRTYELRFEVLRNPEGASIGAFLTGRDITERVIEQERLAEAEAGRREADALYRAYFENTPEALFVVAVEPDGGFVVEEINPAHEAGVGLRLEAIRGKRVEDILPERVAQKVLETYRHVVATRAIHQYREAFNISGELQHWDTSLVPMMDGAGRVVRLIGSSRNVTRQVVAEEALRQSQKMEAMGSLTGGVAHDFNNLLTPIVGALDMLQRKGLGGDREQRLISGAAESAERAKVLIQRLLAFARRQPLQPVAVDIARLVRNMAELVSSTMGPQIRVVVDAPDGLPPAKADLNQLEMALLNLAVNARDAMPDGGTLRISASADLVRDGSNPKLRPGKYVCISVADTGVGMDEATLARAVEPFFSTKGVGKGTGLGLSMVHGLASQLGGALTINSRPGVGANIELWLPQTEEAPEAAAIRAEPEAAPGRGTALLVDDEEFVRMSTADMLDDLGFRVIEAASAEQALQVIEQGVRVNVVVTDHLMPGMTGVDLAREVRDRLPDVPVLVVSGYAEVDGIAADLPRLAKPFRKDELASSLAALGPSKAR